MKNILLGIGKIITFIILIIILGILISKFFIQFPDIDSLTLAICLAFCVALILIVIPEITEIKFFGLGVKKEDIRYPKIDVKKESLESDASEEKINKST